MLQPVHDPPDQLPPETRDTIRLGKVVEMPHAKAEVPVERVNQDLESGLQGLEVDPLVFAAGLVGSLLGLYPELSKVLEESRKDPQGVLGRKTLIVEDDGGVQGGHIAIEDVGCHPLVADIRVAAEDLGPGRGGRDRGALTKIFPEEQGVYFGSVPPEDDILVTQGKDLRLDEIARGEEGCDGPRLSHIVEGVCHEGLRGVVELPTDLFRRDIGAPLGRQVEVPGYILEPVALQVAGGHVVVLGQDPRIHDMSAEDFVLFVGDGPLRNLHPRGVSPEQAAVAAEVKFHPVPVRPGLDVLQVKAKEVMPFDHVRIPLLDEADHFPEHVRLGHLRA